MWSEADTDGDEALARQMQREEEEEAQQASNQRAAAAVSAAIVPYRSATAAAAASSLSSSSLTTQLRSSSLTRDSPAIQILQRQVSELLREGHGATVDIRALFALYNAALFDSALDSVHVEWSGRMKLCAGVCSFQPQSHYCRIALSSALLQYRPISDVVQTLLHESIHALLFLGPQRCTDRDSHGPQFLAQMHRINGLLGTRITVYHTFEDEVELYRTHIWKCTGPCVSRAPYFGLVKRSSNRAPGPNDSWWSRHTEECGGAFEKIAAPPPSKEETAREKRREEKERKERMQRRMDAFVVQDASAAESDDGSKPTAAAAASSSSRSTTAPAAASTRQPRAVPSTSAAAAASSKATSTSNSSAQKSSGSTAGAKRKSPAATAASAPSSAAASKSAPAAATADPHATLAPIFRASPRKAPKPSSSASAASTSAAAHASPICLDDDGDSDLVDLTQDDAPVAATAAPAPVVKKPRIDSSLNPAFTLVCAGSVAASAAVTRTPSAAVAALPRAAPADSSAAASTVSTSDLSRDRRAERARAVDLLAARAAGRASPSVLPAPVAAS